ncbi:hypothetical protein Zmor_015471 [Zophobas morio]|uniref:Peptidase S1 domain-containing protein n=1 Tax=Zophobas morio TaxID=2755281 RepID=A0AA38IKB9_9CUCU|nr:hypothetical protein Zmor_015471 [Zophobas morio]
MSLRVEFKMHNKTLFEEVESYMDLGVLVDNRCNQETASSLRTFRNKFLGVRIIGGQEAYVGEFPYAAAICKSTAEGNYFCTGAVVSIEWVLTAGPCLDGAILFTILMGTHKLSGDDASIVIRLGTEHYVLHPDYNPSTLANDIGLIKFRGSITFTPYINRLYLPYEAMDETTTGVAYGWGQTSDGVL